MFCPRCHRAYDGPSRRFCPDDGAELLGGPRIAHIRARPTRELGAILEGRYRVRGIIGNGAMSRVYLAEDTRTGEPVAVKILNRDVAQDPVQRERFLREIEVAASIGHPNVVQVFDAGERPDGSPFIVLEFLHGESLGDLLRRDSAVEPAFALPLLAQAAGALSAAHRAGIIHRDVKPDNLFLCGERGAPYAMKVVDFGMAKLEEARSLSQTGVTLGTLAYIAPEQSIADPVDARTDVYGLGVVMYRMFAGSLPFDVEDQPSLVASHLFVTPRPPSAARPGLDPRIDTVVMTALRKRPENRYPTMAALAEDLDRIMGRREGQVVGAPITVTPDRYEAVKPTGKAAAEVLAKIVRF